MCFSNRDAREGSANYGFPHVDFLRGAVAGGFHTGDLVERGLRCLRSKKPSAPPVPVRRSTSRRAQHNSNTASCDATCGAWMGGDPRGGSERLHTAGVRRRCPRRYPGGRTGCTGGGRGRARRSREGRGVQLQDLYSRRESPTCTAGGGLVSSKGYMLGTWRFSCMNM